MKMARYLREQAKELLTRGIDPSVRKKAAMQHERELTENTFENIDPWPPPCSMNSHAIERQLAHAERSKVRAAYNFAEFLPERRKIMQAWADYLDMLKSESPTN
ncbi:MAG: hypothetical protein LUG50_05580 [Planctomycetaceae bacterium]|nr:hypothetical protein [Planctomycetaceae bacterium]